MPLASSPPHRYRVDELARLAGTTVRNVRALQERGIVRPPRLEGRTGYHDTNDLQTLRCALRLQARGHSLAGIADLFATWRAGGSLEEVLGLRQRPTGSDRARGPAEHEEQPWDAAFDELAPGPGRAALVLVPGLLAS
jgi:DNA-binding transcriptional MerR regulator